MHIIRWTLAAGSILAGLAQGQPSGSISGVVRESTTGAPLEAARVMIFEHDVFTKQVFTDGSCIHAANR
jgi:hypothetical protein